MDTNNMNTKSLIQSTAIRLFKEKGYDNVSINEIAEACEITKAGFYYHFKSKDELISGYYNNIYQKMPDNFLDALMLKSNVEKLWFFLSLYIDYTVHNGSDILSQIFKSNLDSDKQTFTNFDGKIKDICITLIDEAQKSGEINNNSKPENIFDVIANLIIGIAIIWSIKKGSFDEKLEIKKQFNTLLGLENQN